MSSETDKAETFRNFVALGTTCLVVDATFTGVDVPEGYRSDTRLKLNFSFKFDPPDLRLNSWGVRETLSFKGKWYKVAVPWGAVLGMVHLDTGQYRHWLNELSDAKPNGPGAKLKLVKN